ncbi:MAG: DUF2100 domain-containing protein [Candidatus Hydrothermarchaeota archaeon]
MKIIEYRLSQARKLLESCRLNASIEVPENPKGNVETRAIRDLIQDLIEIEDLLRNRVPAEEIEGEDAKFIVNTLLEMREKINNILPDFGVKGVKAPEKEIDLNKKMANKLIILMRSSDRKKLSEHIDARRIIATGTPLFIEDMRDLKPDLPETAIKSIEKKIQGVKREIESKIKELNIKEIIVLMEDEDKYLERAKELYENVRVVRCFKISDLSIKELSEIIG